MADAVLTKTRMRAGVWEGVLDVDPPGEAPPPLEVVHLETALDGLTVEPDPMQEGRYLVSVPVPVDLLSDGVQTFLIRDPDSGARLASFAIVTGEPLEDDIRAEMDLLRAELDMLKKAFRRHCLETM